MSRVLKDKTNQITQGYGNGHYGIDLVGKEGLPEIIAHSDGVVYAVQIGQDNNIKATGVAGYGNYVQIKHSNNMYTLYAHLKKGTVKVKKGQTVKKGDVLGTEGNTGHSFGVHLHFEVRNSNNYVIDPTPYIDADLPNLPTNLPEPVERDTTKYQIEVLIDVLRGRNGYGTDKSILGYVKKGIYNVYEEANQDNYTWVKISKDENIWVAYNKEWATLYRVDDYKELYEKELLVNKDLQAQVNLLNTKLEEYQNKINNIKEIVKD